MQETIAKLIKDINENAVIANFNEDLFANEVLDSLGIAELVASLEETFHFELDPEDILPENFSTVNEIAALVQKYKG